MKQPIQRLGIIALEGMMEEVTGCKEVSKGIYLIKTTVMFVSEGNLLKFAQYHEFALCMWE